MLCLYVQEIQYPVHQWAHAHTHKHSKDKASEKANSSTLMLTWLSCSSTGENTTIYIQPFTQQTSPEQITSDLWGHVANPPLNGNSVGGFLPVSQTGNTNGILNVSDYAIWKIDQYQLRKLPVKEKCCLQCVVSLTCCWDIFAL